MTDNYRTYPAVITKPDGTAIEDYRIFYIGDEIACFNWEKSDYDERNSELDMPEFLRTIVLDKKLLPSFEAKNVFRLKELYSAIIVNEYAKRILEEAKITGFAYKEVAVE